MTDFVLLSDNGPFLFKIMKKKYLTMFVESTCNKIRFKIQSSTLETIYTFIGYRVF